MLPDVYTRPFETTACAVMEATYDKKEAPAEEVCAVVRTKKRQRRHGIRRKHESRHLDGRAGEVWQSLVPLPYIYIRTLRISISSLYVQLLFGGQKPVYVRSEYGHDRQKRANTPIHVDMKASRSDVRSLCGHLWGRSGKKTPRPGEGLGQDHSLDYILISC